MKRRKEPVWFFHGSKSELQNPQVSLSLSETNHKPKEVALAASSVLSYNGNRVLIK